MDFGGNVREIGKNGEKLTFGGTEDVGTAIHIRCKSNWNRKLKLMTCSYLL